MRYKLHSRFLSWFYTVYNVHFMDNKTCFFENKEVSVKKIFQLPKTCFDRFALSKYQKKTFFVFSSSSIYNFSIVCLVIFTNFFSMTHIYLYNMWFWKFGARGRTKRLHQKGSSISPEKTQNPLFLSTKRERWRNQKKLGLQDICFFFVLLF